MIYGPAHFSKSIYLVVAGKVGISQIADDGSEVLLDIVRPDELFGESAFLDVPPSERATAIEKVKVMAWAVSDMEDLVTKRPRLAVACCRFSRSGMPSSLAGSKVSRTIPSSGASPGRSFASPSGWAPRTVMGPYG